MSQTVSPLDQLIALEQKGRRHVVDLATDEDKREYWRAVAFRVGDHHMLLDEQEVTELLTVPQITVIPGTKHWVSGIANIRGELLPIINFGDFLFRNPVQVSKHARILVIIHDEVRSGLIVDQVFGMRRYPVDEMQPVRQDDLQDVMKAMVTGCYETDQLFHIIKVSMLVNDTEFMQAAA